MRRLIFLGIAVSMIGFITVFSTVSSQSTSAQSSQSDVVVQSYERESLSGNFIKRIKSTWPWYLARTSGLVSATTLIILMLSGIGLITGYTFKLLEPITAWATHRALGIVFVLSTILHIVALYFDNFVPFDLKSLLIPFVSQYKTSELFGVSIGSFYIASGVISLYIAVAIIITSLLWINKHAFLWKITHLFSYLAMLLIFVHGLYLGTDLSRGILRWIWIGLAYLLIFTVLTRLWRSKTV